MANTEKKDSVRAARALLQGSVKAALGTLQPDGAPLVTMVALATAADGSPLLLLSEIAAHTKNIVRDPRVSLLVEAERTGDDPMTDPRLSINGRAALLNEEETAAAKPRFVARHPGSAAYDTELDFHYYRLEIESARFNQGFGAFRKLGARDLLVEPVDGAE